jgi:hypothetical protein
MWLSNSPRSSAELFGRGGAERSGFAISQKKRKLVERVFGWGKLDSLMRKIKLHGVRRGLVLSVPGRRP